VCHDLRDRDNGGLQAGGALVGVSKIATTACTSGAWHGHGPWGRAPHVEQAGSAT